MHTLLRSHHILEYPRLRIDEFTPLLLVKEEQSAYRPQVAARSSLTQTIFNTVNLIFGIGLLGFPLAFKRAGFLYGSLLFVWSAATTLWTARMIERCLARHKNIHSFGDLASAAYGPAARVVVTALVALELTAASVGQIGIFADGMQTFVGGSNEIMWKVICGAAFIPLSCAPLRFLGVSSALSVFCFFLVSVLLVQTGLTRYNAPGSLHHPMHVSAFPESWSSFSSSIGMILSAWGGHTVFPELYRDMENPEKFFKGIKTSYAVSFPLYIFIGVVGYLMFGDGLRGPITSELISLEKSLNFVSIGVISLIAFMPIAKVPLNVRPLGTALHEIYRSYRSDVPEVGKEDAAMKTSSRSSKAIMRIAVGFSFVILAIIFPDLDKVMSVLGVVAGLMIAVIFPICCYLSIMRDQISVLELLVAILTIVFATALGVGGISSLFGS